MQIVVSLFLMHCCEFFLSKITFKTISEISIHNIFLLILNNLFFLSNCFPRMKCSFKFRIALGLEFTHECQCMYLVLPFATSKEAKEIDIAYLLPILLLEIRMPSESPSKITSLLSLGQNFLMIQNGNRIKFGDFRTSK